MTRLVALCVAVLFVAGVVGAPGAWAQAQSAPAKAAAKPPAKPEAKAAEPKAARKSARLSRMLIRHPTATRADARGGRRGCPARSVAAEVGHGHLEE